MYSDKDTTKLMGERAREYIINNFSKQISTSAIIQVLEDVAKK